MSPRVSPRIRAVSLVLAFAAAAPAAHGAKSWVEHPADFPSSPLCQPNEVTLWTCTVGHKRYSLCASGGAVRRGSYIQYRARDRRGKTVLRYPDPLRAPAAAFAYAYSATGDAEVDFSIDGYSYSLVDPLRGVSMLFVEKAGKELAHLTCDEGNQSLQLNDTIALMRALKVPAPP
ncbi:hypothetical protein GALL_241610 [mine drainage metagenome]|uniref:Uncharacterized protein n=1 Tax=mine drainage metagenome TaxID=410659 RepID=A0A1J5RET2_9ZZZZ